MSVIMIAAMARNRVIGADNHLPWKLPDDMAFFKRSTLGKTVLMGRKTLESFNGALKGRQNVVLTRQTDYRPADCVIVHSVEEAMERYAGEELMVIGGAEIYRQLLPFADTVLLTEVDAELPGDALFPALDPAQWELTETVHHAADERHNFAFDFNTYRRKRNG